MDGAADPLVVVLGAVAFAVVTIGGIFGATLLWARYMQRGIPSTEEMVKAVREQQEAYSAILKWEMPFSFVLIALAVAAVTLSINGHPALFGAVLVLLVPASLIVGGLSMVRTKVAIVRRPFRWSDRILTGEEAERWGRILIALGLGLLVLCLALTLMSNAGTWLGGGGSTP